MDKNIFTRTETMLGSEAMNKLRMSKVLIFGIGGVGGYVVEALARSGVGNIDIVDGDDVDITNINRQIIANISSVGRLKVDVMKERLLLINPDISINTYPVFYLPEKADIFDFSKYDYIVDAVDTVSAKLSIIENAKRESVPVISAMGAGNKLDPSAFKLADIKNTRVCPLARVMRRELKKRGIENLPVVYSEEEPFRENPERTPASVSFVPAVMGFIMAGKVIKDLAGIKK